MRCAQKLIAAAYGYDYSRNQLRPMALYAHGMRKLALDFVAPEFKLC